MLRLFGTSVLTTLALFASATADDKTTPAKADTSATAPAKAISLFDGKTTGKWQPADFSGGGETKVEDGCLVIAPGKPMSGVVWKGDKLPNLDYEVTFEARRVEGTDFFVGLTFPIKESPCTLIIGGWGGGLTGFSSIDGSDASENETTGFMTVENNKWYKVKLRVTGQRVDAWVDGEFIGGFDHRDRKVDVRLEVEVCRPYGFATYRTKSALRNIQLRPLTTEEKAKFAKEADKQLNER